MFSAVQHLLLCLMLGFYSVSVFSASHPAKMGDIAEQQTRYIAGHFPGRMAGSPAELLTADYLMQQFKSWGYQSDIRQFTARYPYTQANGQQTEQNITGNSVIAIHPGKESQQIIIMAHLDTRIPLSDSDRDNNLGGLSLQGVDDNASGVGVMLELAQRLRNTPTRYSIRFIATSGKQLGAAGASSVLQRMSQEEQKNTLLVINLDSLIVGEKLTFISSATTPAALQKMSRDKAMALAHQFAIPAAISSDILSSEESDFYREIALFDRVGIPVLSVSSGRVSKKHYQPQQRAVRKAFPEGTVHHQAARDNMQYLDKWLPGKIKQRTRDSVRIMLPLVKSLAKAEN